MYHRFLFLVILGLGCLSADIDNLFEDDPAATTSALNYFDSSVDALSAQLNDS